MSDHHATDPFHLAIPVHDLALARMCYGELPGCPEGRSAATWVDFDLFGNQLVAHLKHGAAPAAPEHSNLVDGDDVPVPHFGVVLTLERWQALADRLVAAKTKFVIAPHVRFRGLP